MLYPTLLFTGAIGFLALVLLGTFHGTKGLSRHGKHAHHGHSIAKIGRLGRMRMFTAISPIDIFAICLGMGATGLLLPKTLGSTQIFILSLVVGLLFDFAFLKPIFNLALRFASTPSDGLEGMIAKFATASSKFDNSGRGIVSVVIDGEEKQLLASLDEVDRGMLVQKGEQLMVTGVDAQKNTCRVSRM